MIHAAVGSRAGVGARLTKRSGIVAYAVSSAIARAAHCPSCKDEVVSKIEQDTRAAVCGSSTRQHTGVPAVAAIHSQFARAVAFSLVALAAAPPTAFAQGTTSTCTEIGSTLRCTTVPDTPSSGWLGALGAGMEAYGKRVAAQKARDAAAEAVHQARDAAAESVRRDAAMVQAQQEIAAAANAAATREAERVRMLETSDRERIAAASRLFARRANEVRRTLADSLTLSATRYTAFSDSTSVILSDLFVADPSASSARIADELRPVYRQFQRQRQEFEKTVGAAVSRVMQGKRPFSNAVDLEELVREINELRDDPLLGMPESQLAISVEARIGQSLRARFRNDSVCAAGDGQCDTARLDPAAQQAHAAAFKKREVADASRIAAAERIAAADAANEARRVAAETKQREADAAVRLSQQLASLDRALDSLVVSPEERATAQAHYRTAGYATVGAVRAFVLGMRAAIADSVALYQRKDLARQDLGRLLASAVKQFESTPGIGSGLSASPRLPVEFATHLGALTSRWIDSASLSGLDALPIAVDLRTEEIVRNARNCLAGLTCIRALLPDTAATVYLASFERSRKFRHPAAQVVADPERLAKSVGTRTWSDRTGFPKFPTNEARLAVEHVTSADGRGEYRLAWNLVTQPLGPGGNRLEEYVVLYVDSLTGMWTRAEAARDVGNATGSLFLSLAHKRECSVAVRIGADVRMRNAVVTAKDSSPSKADLGFALSPLQPWIPEYSLRPILAARLDDFLVGKSFSYSNAPNIYSVTLGAWDAGRDVVLLSHNSTPVTFSVWHKPSGEGGIALFGTVNLKERPSNYDFGVEIQRVVEACTR